jgi:monolysocardiolipin acyltransferase
MHVLNSTEVQGAEVMDKALKRPQGQALITVCNHVAALDDPLVMATVIPKEHYLKPENIRYP